MASGYTYGVKDGTVTSFRDFAQTCARAFGANILMRDEPLGASIREYEPNTYHRDELERAKARLYDAERMTLEEAGHLAAAAQNKALKALAESREAWALELVRYNQMLAAARAWEPPTPDHEGLKRFMIEQLEESIRRDCSDPASCYNTTLQSAADFKREAIESARSNIDHAYRVDNQRLNC